MFFDDVTRSKEALRRWLKMDMYSNAGGMAGHAIKAVTFACVFALHGCGGGGAGGSATDGISSSNQVQSPTSGSNGTTTTPDTLAQLEAFTNVATPGWTEPTGTSLVDVSTQTGWIFNSQKTTSWVPGSVSALTYSDTSKAIALNFDFGCTTSVLTTRDADCRNVVAMYSNVKTPISATSDALIALTVRNVDVAAEYALRVRDSSGQTLQYPFSIRTIEQQNPAQWAKVRVPLKYPSVYWGGANNGSVTGSITQISIVAAPRNSNSGTLGLNYPKGTFELKSAQFFANAGTTYKLQSNASVNTAGLIPSLNGRMAIAHGNFDPVLLRKAKDAGFTAVRRDLFWDVVERSGAYSFSEFTNGADNLTALGMKVLWIIDYGHPDHGGAVPVSSADLQAYGRFVQAVAQFGKTVPVLGYEIWNEPNLPGWWPTPDPVAYGNLFSAAVTAIRQYDSATPVVSGGVTIDEPSYLFKLAKTGVLSRASGIGIHPYRKDTFVTTSPTFSRLTSTPEMYANDRLIAKHYLASQGVTAPMWNTEAGYSSVFFLDPLVYPDALSSSALNRQGVLLLRSVLTQIALNEPLITVYRLKDSSVSATDKEQNFGLLDANGVEKPAYVALKNLNTLIAGKSFNGNHTDVPPGMHALRWTDTAGNKVVCMWADNIGESISTVLPAGVKSVVSWNGAVMTAKSGDTISLSEASGPIYVKF